VAATGLDSHPRHSITPHGRRQNIYQTGGKTSSPSFITFHLTHFTCIIFPLSHDNTRVTSTLCFIEGHQMSVYDSLFEQRLAYIITYQFLFFHGVAGACRRPRHCVSSESGIIRSKMHQLISGTPKGLFQVVQRG